MSQERYFDKVSDRHMPGESRAGFEVLVSSLNEFVPGFRDMIYETLDQRFLASGGGDFSYHELPFYKEAGAESELPLIVRVELDPVGKAHTISSRLTDPARRRMIVHMYSSYPKGEKMHFQKLNLALGVNGIGEGKTDLEAAVALDSNPDGSSSIIQSRRVDFRSSNPIGSFVSPEDRADLDHALRSEFNAELYHAIMSDTVGSFEDRMEAIGEVEAEAKEFINDEA